MSHGAQAGLTHRIANELPVMNDDEQVGTEQKHSVVFANDPRLITFWIIVIDFLMDFNEVTERAKRDTHPGVHAAFQSSVGGKTEMPTGPQVMATED